MADRAELIELIAAKVHDQWMETKRSQGITSRTAEWGEEFMRPYAELSEPAKDLDRGTVLSVIDGITALAAEGVTLDSLIEAATAPESNAPAPSPVSATTEAHDGTTKAQEARE